MRRLAAGLIPALGAALLGAAAATAQTPEPRRAYPGETRCPVDLPSDFPRSFTDTEQSVWQGVCRGDFVDLGEQDTADLPCKPADIDGAVPAHRLIGADFLALILTDKRLVDSLARPQVNISCARVDGRLDLRNEIVVPEFLLIESHLPQGVDFLYARFQRTLSVSGSTFDSSFNAAGMRVDGSLMLHNKARFHEVNLRSAEIAGNLEANGSVFQGLFDADAMRVDSRVFLDGGAVFDRIVLRGAQIGNSVEAQGSSFEGLFNAARLRVDGDLFLRGNANFSAISLLGARISNDVQFGGSSFSGRVDATGANIGGEMTLSSSSHGHPRWGPGASLVLRNASANALQADQRAWQLVDKSLVPTDLTGFSYDRLGGLLAGENETMADSSPDWLIKWVQAQPAHYTRYDPQPYEQLANALDIAGKNDKAKTVRVAKLEHKRNLPETGFLEATGLWITRWTVGHGHYPINALVCFFILVFLGVIAASRSKATVINDPTKAKVPTVAGWFWYSLENTLPLVPLKPALAAANHGSAWIEGFFHLQKILGFVLATILVGALTVLGG